MKIFSDRCKRAVCHELVHLNAVLIQFSRKCRSNSTQWKKPFSFNPVEKAVPHSTQWKKPFPFNPVEKAVLTQLI
jgi:hypothetical protein